MSFFSGGQRRSPAPAPSSGAGVAVERGVRGAVPDRMEEERARIAAIVAEREARRAASEAAGLIEVPGEVVDPRGRGGKLTPGKAGLTNETVLDRPPRGVLIRLTTGWFDLDGFWCVRRFDGTIAVHRGASRGINARLTKGQRREMERARLNARRRGVR